MKKNCMFGSIVVTMLLGVFALTSCVQDDMYELYDDGFESGFVRFKKSKDYGGGSSNPQNMAHAWTSNHTDDFDHVYFDSDWENESAQYMDDFAQNKCYEMGGFAFSDGSCVLFIPKSDPGKNYSITLPPVEANWGIVAAFHLHPGNSDTVSKGDSLAAEYSKKKDSNIQSYNYTRNSGFTNSLTKTHSRNYD